METRFPIDHARDWPTTHIKTCKPWFRLAGMLGEGENGAVFSLGPSGREVVYSESDSSDSSDSDMDSDGSCSVTSSCSYTGTSGGSAQEEEEGGGVGEEDEDTMEFNEEEVRVMDNTCMGRVQVVAKQFRHLDEDVGYVLVDASERTLLKWFVDEEEAQDYIRRRQFNSPRFGIEEVASHMDDTTVRFSNFTHEALTTLALSELVKTGKTPHLTLAVDAVSHKNTGYLLLERLDACLDELLNEPQLESQLINRLLTPTEVCSLFFQTLFGLCTVQRMYAFKHHDLHSGNVFVKRILPTTEFNNQALSLATHFHYHLDGHDFYLPNCGLLTKLGDFSMASFTLGGKRVQRVDMDAFNDNPEKWGYWNANYEGERGYDTQFLFADVPVDGRHRKCSQLHKFLKVAKLCTMGKRGKVTSKKGRPVAGHISNLPADSVLLTVFVKKVLPHFLFTAHPTGDAVRIVTLGDSRTWV